MRYKRRKLVNDNIAHLDKRITIQVTSDISDDGFSNNQSTEFYKCWAELLTTRERDYQMSLQTNTNNQSQFRIRYKDGITTKMTLIYNNEEYDIVDKIGEDSRQPYMILVCERKEL